MQTRTLTQLLADVRFASDTQALTSRHSDADLTLRLNDSIRSLRALITASGMPYFLTDSGEITLVGTAVANEGYSEIAWPTTAVQIHGVDCQFANSSGFWYPLRPVTWVQRRNFVYGSQTGAPVEFAIRKIPEGSGASTVPGVIALFPAASTGSVKVWYLPDFTDLASGTDVFVTLPDWIVWVVQDVVRILAERDDDQRETYQIATQKQAEAEARLLAAAQRTLSAGPLRPRRGRRRS